MFRHLIMVIFRLYKKHSLSSYKNIYGLFIWDREGVNWARNHVCVKRLGGLGYMKVPCCYQAMSKLIIVKSMIGVILCLCVLCNYTKV